MVRGLSSLLIVNPRGMKRTIAIIVVGLLVGLGGLYAKNTFNFEKEIFVNQTVEVEKIVEVDKLQQMIKDAQDQKSTQIKAAGEEARKQAETNMLEAIELEVRTTYRKELEAKEIELEKKSGF